MSNEYRILRDRHAALSDAIDRADVAAPAGADRRLVRVFDGGSFPTTGDKFFLTHPVQLNCPEREGTDCSPAVDANTTLAVAFLRNAPKVDDIIVATAAGGRWVAEIGHSEPACVWICGPSLQFAPPAGGGPGDTAQGTVAVAADGAIGSIGLLYGGRFYTTNPTVTIVPGGSGGSGATATATVGPVSSLTTTNAGAGYNPAAPPSATIAAPGGSGTTATVAVTVLPGDGSLQLAIANGGSLYTTPNPTVTIDPPPPGGTQATATANALPGVVVGLKLTNPGTGYFYPRLPDHLDFTLACPAWTFSFPLAQGGAPIGPAQPPPFGAAPYCIYSGSTVATIPATAACPAIAGVTLSASLYFSPQLGGAWLLGVELIVHPQGSRTFPCADQCYQGIGPPPPPWTLYCLGTSQADPPVGALIGEGYQQPGPLGGLGIVRCTSRPFTWTATAQLNPYPAPPPGECVPSGTEAYWYILCGGSCPAAEAGSIQPNIPLTATLSEP